VSSFDPTDAHPPTLAKATLWRKKRLLGEKDPLSLVRPKMIARCGR